MSRRDGKLVPVASGGGHLTRPHLLPYAAVHGVPAHYIESSAQTRQVSLTGWLLNGMPSVRLYRQYPHATSCRRSCGGRILRGFEAVRVPSWPLRRTVVTL